MEDVRTAAAPGRLSGRRIFITGAASGIGKATASLFVREGAQVALMDLDGQRLAEAATMPLAHAIPVDVTDEAGVERAFDTATKQLGGFDGLVHCAGVVELGRVAEMSLQSWQRVMDVNLTGTFLVCRESARRLERKDGATIVTIASAQALQPLGTAAAYAASKGGVLSFTKALAADLAPHVRVNTICPGLVDTPMNQDIKGGPGSGPPVPLDRYLLRRWGTAQEIAATILFLTSVDSAYVTGATLAVDGGRTFH
jgi:NAD(P)-dependent dehydrogenase (short-subunit alcohol dehydrogenase family)